MRHSSVRPVLLAAMLVAAALGAGQGPARAVDPSDVSRARALTHWTEERMRSATALDAALGAPVRAESAAPSIRGSGSTDAPSVLTQALEPSSEPWGGGGAVAARSGKVFLTIDGSDYVCSGSVIQDDGDPDRSLVLTAAHCAYDNEVDIWASDWVFIPDWQAAPTYDCTTVARDCWMADALVIHAAYAVEDELNVAAARHDYAVAVVGRGLYDDGQLDAAGAYPVRIGPVPAGDGVDVFGYPAAPPFSGDELVRCSGTVEVAALVGGWATPCDMTPGASGGPWLHGASDPADGSGSVGSVSSYRIEGDPRLFGPRFDGATQAVIDLANAAVPDGGAIDRLMATGTTPPTVARLAGPDRYATAAAISAATFPSPPVPVAYVATGANFPDALAGGPAAAAEGGPVLLVTRDAIPAVVATELRRLRPARIRVLGGPSVVSSAVLTALTAYTSGPVTRLAGPDRYATAATVVGDRFGGAVGPVFVATGTNFPDALAGGAAAAASGAPIVLAAASDVPAATMAALATLTPTGFVLLGGPSVLGPAVVAELQAAYPAVPVTRWSGPDRYATSAAISAAAFGAGAATAFLATGTNFPDALAGVPAAALADGPLLLTRRDCLPPVVAAELARLRPTKVVLLGGRGAIGTETPALPCGG
jgi:putative cell wall-binding protein